MHTLALAGHTDLRSQFGPMHTEGFNATAEGSETTRALLGHGGKLCHPTMELRWGTPRVQLGVWEGRRPLEPHSTPVGS